MSDEDTAGHPAETEVFETTETQGLAWSQADVENVSPYLHTHPTRLALIAAASVGLVGVAAYFIGAHRSQPQAVQTPPTVTTSTVTVAPPVSTSTSTNNPPAVAAPPDTQTSVKPSLTKPEDPDTVYLSLLDKAQVHFATRDAAIYNGHLICEAFDRGESFQAIASAIQAKSPQVDYGQVAQGVGAAIFAYCPQYQQ